MRPVLRALLLAAAGGLLATGCINGDESQELTQNEVLHRMQRQAKFKYYQQNPFYPDMRAMRTPPEGTVSREAYRGYRLGGPYLADGFTFRDRLPLPADAELLALGKKNFEIVCAACHGMLGDGQSMVAMNMALMPPPSFHSEKLLTKPDGYIFKVASDGYGAMPPFAWRLTAKERWAVVAYIRALQLSQAMPLADASPEARRRLMQEGQ